MIVAHVASEVAPWSQTGGLAEVLGALPHAQQALADSDLRTAVFTPLYRCVRERLAQRGIVLRDPDCRVDLRFVASRYSARFLTFEPGDSSPIHFLDCPALYDRAELYGVASGDYPDNALRFAFLARAVLKAAATLLDGQPDILHCHDWQTGLLPVYLALDRHDSPEIKPGTKTVFTIHNLAYQGVFPKEMMSALDLPFALFTPEQLEYYDKLCFLKGMGFADAVTTVSRSYAREIMQPAFGCNLDGFLRHQVKRVYGIVNGVDTETWNPDTDEHIPAHFSIADRSGKQLCRHALAGEFSLALERGDFVCGVVWRLAEQKGLDLLAEVVPKLHDLGVKVVLLGSGSSQLESRFLWLADKFRDDLAVRIGFDVAMSHWIYAGCDGVLMPSRFEPCGLSQLYSMRYGTIPIAHAVGGLRDTVIDPGDDELARGVGTGFVFEDASAESLLSALARAATMWREDPVGWSNLVSAAMSRDSSWAKSASEYLRVYRELVP